MSWLKKPSVGDENMPNVQPAAKPTGPEPVPSRPEPRTVRPEPRAAAPSVEPPRSEPVRAPETKPVEAPVRASVLGPTLRFRGELSAQEDLIVQGSVEGSITHTQSLSIGTDGSMKGDIRARVVIIDGKVDGDLYATDSVTIRATAKVRGNVFAPRVAISDGAFFQGLIEMQPSGAAVQEHSARLRAAAASPPLEAPQVDQMLASRSQVAGNG